MFNIHWQPYHYDGTEPPYFAEMGVKFVKIVWMGNAPPYIEHIPPEAKLIYRDFGFEEQNRHLLSSDPLECAAVHVQRCVDTCANLLQRGLSKDRQLYESINEPQIWAGETKANVCTYCEAFLEGLHAHGLHGVIGNLSVGWPDNSGPETPPVWDWFYPALDAMEPGDYLGAHEYWSDGGCGEMWG